VLYINILKLLPSLILSAFIDYIQNKLFRNVKDINNNREIKVNIIFKVKCKLFKQLAVFLIVFIIFNKIFKSFIVNIIACLF
jgi:hypothetical protein